MSRSPMGKFTETGTATGIVGVNAPLYRSFPAPEASVPNPQWVTVCDPDVAAGKVIAAALLTALAATVKPEPDLGIAWHSLIFMCIVIAAIRKYLSLRLAERTKSQA